MLPGQPPYAGKAIAINSWAPPRLRSALTYWLRLDDARTVRSSGKITTVVDHTGAAVAAQTTDSARPVWVENGLNGRPVARFAGAEWLDGSSVFSGAAARTIAAVYKPRINTGTHAICGQSGIIGAGKWAVIQSRVSPQGDPYFAGYAADLTGPAKDTTAKIELFTYDGATGVLYKNGTEVNTGALTLDTNASVFRIGASQNVLVDTEFFDGDIAEVIVVSRVVTSTERASLHRYLSFRYAIAVA